MSEQKTVYISGAISNKPRDIVEAAFADAERRLRNKGYWTINPIDCIVEPEDVTLEEFWVDCMRQAIRLLVDADEIYMLEGWNHSRGAILERLIALSLGMDITYEGGKENYVETIQTETIE